MDLLRVNGYRIHGVPTVQRRNLLPATRTPAQWPAGAGPVFWLPDRYKAVLTAFFLACSAELADPISP
jgi:hypothetical protein